MDFAKKASAVLIIFLLCLNIAFCTEETGIVGSGDGSGTPQAGTEVNPAAIPAALPDSTNDTTDGIPAILPSTPEDSNVLDSQKQEELQKTAAKQFYDDIDKIVSKHISSYYKNGGKGTIGIYIKELNSDFKYGYNDVKTNEKNPQEGYFNTASTCKLLAAAVVYYLDNTKMQEVDKVYRDRVTGWQYNLKKIMYKMITHSVNDYFNITLRQLGSKRINEMIAQLGIKNSYVYSEIMPAAGSSVSSNIKRYGMCRSPRTTPRDLGHILELLYEGETFGKDNDALFAESLKHNIYSSRLPKGIAYKSVVGHKTGTSPGEGVYNDAGIIYLPENPYIMVVMSNGCPASVQSLYHRICKDIYEYMKNRAVEAK